jgi:PAS domain S-box-containing protein
LFVESSPQVCEAVSAAFTKAGSDAHLTFVPSPEAGLAAFKRETIDAVFVSQLDSGMDALAFLSHLAAINREAPVIMMTLHPEEEVVLRALRSGAADCVSTDLNAINQYPAVALRTIARAESSRESSERALAIIRSQKQWMSIIDAITDFLFVLDSTQTIVKVNNAFATAIGSHPRVIVGNRIQDVFNLDIPNEAFLQTVHQDGMPRTYEKKIGEEVYQISIFPLLEDNRPLTIHIMKNITEVRRLKDQLYHTDKLASIGLLASGVAHEINNPLTGAIAYTELLAMKVTDEDTKADLKKILDSAERCKRIVDNLMTFSRQRAPSQSLESVNDLINRAIELQGYVLKSNNIEIQKEFDPASTVFVDAQQIQQVILNLLVNAEQAIVDSGRSNGRIKFVTRYDKDAKLVVISIIDNGPGIPQQIANKVFDPFFTTKPVGIGTGLGLSIAHGIITEHGGTIRFENVEGGGAAFTIEIPTGSGTLSGSAE